MKPLTVSLVMLVSVIGVGTAHAQTPPDGFRVFVASHAGPKWDDLYQQSRRTTTPVVEGGVSLGIESPTAGVEVSLSVSDWHEKRNAPQRFRYVGPTSGFMQQGHSYEYVNTFRRRSPEVDVLFRKNRQVREAVTMTWVVGGAYAFRPEEYAQITNEVLPDDTLVEVHRQAGRSTRNYFAAVAGLEATVRVSRNLAIVPRLRLTAFPNLMDESTQAPRHFVVRPQVAVRWTF